MSNYSINIRPNDLKIVQDILRHSLPSNSKAWVFGSRATPTIKRSSDLDLAIDAGRPLTKQENSALSNDFEESDLPYTVDVVDMHKVSEAFKVIIMENMIELKWT